jgi:integrase/recombinase XerD
MLDQLIHPRRRRFVLDRIRANPLGAEIRVFAEYLRNRGHTLNTTLQYLQSIEHLGTWLGRNRIAVKSLGEQQVESFLVNHLPRCSCPPPHGRAVSILRAAAHRFLCCLRENALVQRPTPKPLTALDLAIQDFDRHLIETCGLAPHTRVLHLRAVRLFLEYKYGRGLILPNELEPHDLMSFVATRAQAVKPSTARSITSALRSYLRYLQLQGLCDGRLVLAIPRIPMWSLAHIPKTISALDLGRFLSSFNRSTSTGRRDYAMALCLVDCGLRVCEVTCLRLSDIDWRQGTLLVPATKTHRERLLPLSARLGRAIADYLRRDRPRSPERLLFLRHRAPLGRPVSKDVVRSVMRRMYARSGAACWTGPHCLRHTLATRMLQGGARMKEIADVLGHSSIDTTAIYAKVNLSMLRQVPLSWPREVQP